MTCSRWTNIGPGRAQRAAGFLALTVSTRAPWCWTVGARSLAANFVSVSFGVSRSERGAKAAATRAAKYALRRALDELESASDTRSTDERTKR